MRTAPNYGCEQVDECVLARGGESPGAYHYRAGRPLKYLELSDESGAIDAAKRHARAMGLQAYRCDIFGDLVPA